MPRLLTFLLLAAIPAADSATDLGSQAETAFREAVRLRDNPPEARRLFRQAAAAYERLWQKGARSPELCHNQGNAHLLAGDLAGAILAYRRGLRLAPNDRDLQRSLAHAREQVVYPVSSSLGRPAIDHWPPWLPRPTRGPLLGLMALAYTGGWLALTRWRMTRSGRWLSLGVIAFVLSLLPAGALAVLEWQSWREQRHPLVVIARDEVYLLKGSAADYPRRYDQPLHRGVEARQRFERGEWLQLELAGGEVGWVHRSAVLCDEP